VPGNNRPGVRTIGRPAAEAGGIRGGAASHATAAMFAPGRLKVLGEASHEAYNKPWWNIRNNDTFHCPEGEAFRHHANHSTVASQMPKSELFRTASSKCRLLNSTM